MVKPSRLSALMTRIATEDPSYLFMGIFRKTSGVSLRVSLSSLSAFVELRDGIDLPIIMKRADFDGGEYTIEWDVSGLGFGKKEVTPFCFDGRDDAKRARRESIIQEEEGAELIGGRRHVGSGAIPGLKSDASSDRWQMEAKYTRAASIRVTLSWLSQISSEARDQDRWPILHIKFLEIPSGISVKDKWVLIPADVFAMGRW